MRLKRIMILPVLLGIIICWNNDLFCQDAKKTVLTECPKEKIRLHLSQESLFPGETLAFKIYCTSALFPKEDLSSVAFVELVSPENTSVLRKKVLLKNGQGNAEFEIPQDLQTGIYYVLTYTNWLKNFGESSFFKKAILVINPLQPLSTVESKDSSGNKRIERKPENTGLKISVDQKRLSPRSLVSLKLFLTDKGELPGNLSVSVYRKEPEMIFNSGEELVQPSAVPEKINFLPDYQGLRLGGKLVDNSGKPISAGLITLSTPGPGTELEGSMTDSDGNFNFLLKPEKGEKEIVFSLPQPNLKIVPEESFVNGFRSYPHDLKWNLNAPALAYLKKKYTHFQLQGKFQQQYFVPAKKINSPRDSTLFYSEPYTLIKLKDYLKLDSLREYFYELVPSVKFNKRNDELEVSVFDPRNYSSLKDKPAIFIDGVFYNNFSAITKIPVSEIDRFVVIPKEYYYRDFNFGGIIDIHTRKSDFNGVPLLANMSRMIYPLAASGEWSFSAPDYSKKRENERIPDLRYLLYWNPNTGDSHTIQFYTGDVKGIFTIKIVGIAGNGEIVEAENDIQVGD